MSKSREQFVYFAKVAEQAERYDEMVEAMNAVARMAKDQEDLNDEERNLLSVAYKNKIGSRRASWRILTSIEEKEERKSNTENVGAVKEFRKKVEAELSAICDEVIQLLDKNLIRTGITPEASVFYHKM